ncbi:hypothetical protein RvY_06442 [Ramazzottius varieornatus]|uniref:Uncharacterized protein n=1 Tax=Ramazzottius varieornatus TaxID=947166 RepID=A0A1D1V879_RAMVA|nr:hypothetical protein RvY_06442 [Ramazzottius varieornatus]
MESESATSPDFLLSASIFHQQASSLFSQRSPLSAYFTSLWLQELPEDKRGSLKTLSTNICPYCGTQRNPDNVKVSVQSRKRCTRNVSKILSKQARRFGESKEVAVFQQSRNQICFRCEVCRKTFTQPSIPRSTQKKLKEAAETAVATSILRTKEVSTAIPAKPSEKLPVTPTSIPSSARKRKVKDKNAGLLIPASISSFKKALNSPSLNSRAPPSQPMKSLLDRFLM